MTAARLAVLISGSGRTLENLIHAYRDGRMSAEPVVVVSSRAGVRGLEIAAGAGIPSFIVARSGFADDDAFTRAIHVAIEPYRPDLIICAGFLKRLVVENAWEGRILNIHPALIGESQAAGAGYFGRRVHEAVLGSGAAESGATVHLVDNEYDHGPVLMQQRVPVLPGDDPDSLAARVFAAECDLYPRAIDLVVARRLTLGRDT